MKLEQYLQTKYMKYLTPAAVAALSVFIITFVALFIPPFIGMADNGDYFRILYSNGLYFNDPNYDSKYLGYFIKNFGIFQYYNENGATLFSSQSIFIKLSITLNQWFYSSEIYDIRFQAALYLILYTVAIYLLVEALTHSYRSWRAYAISLLTVFIFADTAYTAYFSSFYSESVVIISLIYLTASMLLMKMKKYPIYVSLTIFAIASLFLTTSKQQNAPVGVIIAVVGILIIFYKRQLLYRIITSFVLIAILFTGIGTYALISDEFKNINKYHAMNRGILLQNDQTEQALQYFDIDRQYALLSEQIYYEPYTTVDVNAQSLEEGFYSKYGYVSILLYYITHPDRAIEMLNIAAKNGFDIRPQAMGNFEESAGKPFAKQTLFFSLYSILKSKVTPHTFGYILIWSIIVLAYFFIPFVRAIKQKNMIETSSFLLILLLLLIGYSAIAVSIIGAGDADLAKHQFLFTACYDVIIYLFITAVLRRKI